MRINVNLKYQDEKYIEKNLLIKIDGLVQGVGFRPFIYKLAQKYNITGWVENANDGVYFEINVNDETNNFIEDIEKNAPKASQIYSINITEIPFKKYHDFSIVKSNVTSQKVTEISPDIAVCDDCLEDIRSQKHRINYPFTNCTNCGPRFSIIKELPYDRERTTMSVFPMCPVCETEYSDIYDRRFHAQPVACNSCGPKYYMQNQELNFTQILELICKIIDNSGVIAIKGIGGYHLTCDARSEVAVAKLRQIKRRDGKPLAVMSKDAVSASKIAEINEEELKLLESWRKPIVLLSLMPENTLPFDICRGLNKIGVMLPYMPIHHLLFEKLSADLIVLTSANISKEPIIIDDEIAEKTFAENVDAVIHYNREIYNRTDDSVCIVQHHVPKLIRRSRSYAPSPIRIKLNAEGIFAAGAELENTFAIGKGNQIIISQYIGDLQSAATLDFYEQTYSRFSNLFLFNPEIAVCDLHPDYNSSIFTKNFGIETIQVQHHHAHIASAMAENELDEKVIGISFDGTGLGDDGNIWGGEIFVCDLNNYERKYHFEYLPVPGGDIATKEVWRSGLSLLYRSYGMRMLDLNIPLIENYKAKARLIMQAIDKKINSPLSSSAGRLFDGISAILGICTEAKYHAEAPMLLESVIQCSTNQTYKYDINNKLIIFDDVIKSIVNDLQNNLTISEISAKFHNTIATICYDLSLKFRDEYGISKVVLSGGTFQNKYLTEKTYKMFENSHIDLFTNSKIPTNDGGIAVGQIAIAAKRRELKCV